MKGFIWIYLCFILLNSVKAQPEPCNPDAMTSTCLDACVVCDIDGFTGRNNLTVQGQTFSGFCTTIFHNMSYIAFIAGTENLTINVSVSNCTIGRGIEVGIFESLDCITFSPVTDCNTDVPANGNATFENTTPLVIGQHYYLIMDGSMGDICNWTFNVIEGSTLVGDLTTSGIIEGSQEICPSLSTTYSTTVEVGATLFDWTLNGVEQSSDLPIIDITFPSDGIYELCVTASNVCDEAPPSCTTINVISQEPTYLVETICANDCIEVAGQILCESGQHELVVTLSNGCDSLVYLDLTVLPDLTSFIDIDLCIGESFSIGDTPYSTTGIFIKTIPNGIGCDSTVTLDLTMIDCELIVNINHTTPICNGDENGMIQLSLNNGIPPFTYEWNHILNTSIGGFGSINSLSDILIENVSAGIYEIYITDNFGDDIVFIQEVIEPPVLTATIDASDYNEYNLTCYNSNDGTAIVTGNGGMPPYAYLWSTNASQASISNLSAGYYDVQLTDANGCTTLANVEMIEPQLLIFSATYFDPNCEGLETGVIELDSITGGVTPYSFALNESEYSSIGSFQNLGSGDYNFSVIDDNGCYAETSATLNEIDIPILFMDEDQEVDLGYEVLISAQTNDTDLINITWTDLHNSLECVDCLETYAIPVNDTEYILTVTSVDGCTTSDSIVVRVDKMRDVYFPNVFSPNDDDINDYFFITTKKSVSSIKKLRVFDRWGELICDKSDLVPNDPSLGWDGRFKGVPVNNGVYVWMAEVEYLDGEILIWSGDLTILK